MTKNSWLRRKPRLKTNQYQPLLMESGRASQKSTKRPRSASLRRATSIFSLFSSTAFTLSTKEVTLLQEILLVQEKHSHLGFLPSNI
jgi:hypothetical protein